MHPLATSAPINTSTLDRDALIAWYRRNRERSRAIFARPADEAYYAQPIALRHPIVFYEGHLPAFSFNTLVKRALGGASIDARLESLFARGIDPADESAADTRPELQWPTRDAVRQFAGEADRQVLDALAKADLERPGHPLLDRAEAVFAILEHEAMHQETLLYMWHRLPLDHKRRPAGYQPRTDGRVPANEWIDIPPGRATLGVDRRAVRFGWDNEFPYHAVDVFAFAIQRDAFGTPDGEERVHPWGDAPPTAAHGVFDFASWDPEPVGTHPAGRSAWGVNDLVGNGWEWTATPFKPFPGFRAMASYPEYSADFFDGDHMVMKGASPATASELMRPTFRNWFRPRYPYVYATFRCVRE